MFLPMFCRAGGWKAGSLKRRAEPSGRIRDQKLVHATVARNAFRSLRVQSSSASEHFWTVRCRKKWNGCGAKHLRQSKCKKHLTSGALLCGKLCKKWTRPWRERSTSRSETFKAARVRSTFGSCGVQKAHAVVARSTCRSKDVKRTLASEHFWKLGGTPLWREAHLDVKRGQILTDFGASDLQVCYVRLFRATGAALRMTWRHFFVAGAGL